MNANINTQHLADAINIMERVAAEGRPFDMNNWNSHWYQQGLYRTETCYKECGTAACFAGWAAVSPEWREAGGKVRGTGAPVFNDRVGHGAISEWLGIADKEAYYLCAIEHTDERSITGDDVVLYPCHVHEITPEMVLEQLYHLRDHGILKAPEGYEDDGF